ncbi:hypothetical protein [Agrobacterium radiobacter]|uniref:hypothetical protein n=1 Tax=Agrobacterium radiobacter TaxID=362 RepID=UPI003F8562D5
MVGTRGRVPINSAARCEGNVRSHERIGRFDIHCCARTKSANTRVVNEKRDAGDDEPPLKFVNRNTGREVKLAFLEEGSGEAVAFRDVRAEAGPGADGLVRWRLSKREERGTR